MSAFSFQFCTSAFLRSLFTQSSHPSCGRLPSFLQPSCFFISVSDHCVQPISFGSLTILPTTSFSSNFFSFKCYVMQMGVGGCQVFRGKKCYEGVSFNVISVTMRWVGGGGAISREKEKRYVTLEWNIFNFSSLLNQSIITAHE